MKFRNMKKFKKAIVISLISGVFILVTKEGDKVYAMFGKKSSTSAQGAIPKTSAKLGGISVGRISGVKQDSEKGISDRNRLLNKIKESFKNKGGQELPLKPITSLLGHEPDKYKRKLNEGVRSHTHIDLSNDIKVKLNIGINSGKLESVVLKTDGKRLFVDASTGDRKITEIIPKSKGESSGVGGTQFKTYDEKTQDVKPKSKQVLMDKSGGIASGAIPKKKIPEYILENGTSTVDNKSFIEKVYKSGGRDVKLLEETLKVYLEGEPPTHGIYKIKNKNDEVKIKVNNIGEIEEVKVSKGGEYIEQLYIKSTGRSEEEIKIHTESVMGKVYESSGLDTNILEDAVKNYDGKVEVTRTENIFKFVSGENRLNIHVNLDGDISYMKLKYRDEFLERSYPFDESEFLLKSAISYKMGFFKVPEVDLYVQKEVFEGTDSRGNKQRFIKNNEGGVDIVVETKDGFFSKVMSSEQQKLFEGIQSTNTLMIKNKDGTSKRVLVEKINVNGTDVTVAHQIEDGLWRIVEKNQDGSLYLGSVLKYENLPSDIKGKLRAALKLYDQYGKLFVGFKEIVK